MNFWYVFVFAAFFQQISWAQDSLLGPSKQPLNLSTENDPRRELDLSQKPWSAIGRLVAFTPSDDPKADRVDTCTATMIGPDLALTAGHCVNNPGDKSKYETSQLIFLAGYKQQKFQKISRAKVLASQFTQSGEPDWALLQLQIPIGNEVGWFSLGQISSKDLQQPVYSAVGYSTDQHDAEVATIHRGCGWLNSPTESGLRVSTCWIHHGGSGGAVWDQRTEHLKHPKLVGISTSIATDSTSRIANSIANDTLKQQALARRGVTFFMDVAEVFERVILQANPEITRQFILAGIEVNRQRWMTLLVEAVNNDAADRENLLRTARLLLLAGFPADTSLKHGIFLHTQSKDRELRTLLASWALYRAAQKQDWMLVDTLVESSAPGELDLMLTKSKNSALNYLETALEQAESLAQKATDEENRRSSRTRSRHSPEEVQQLERLKKTFTLLRSLPVKEL